MEFIIGDYIYCVLNSGQVSPRVADTTKTSYGDIPATVKYNGTTYTIKDLEGWSEDSTSGYTAKGTFYKCENLLVAPSLPNTVTEMVNAFNRCSSLTTPPTIPSGVTRMDTCFSYCTALTTPPTIPSTVTNMGGCFQGCSSLANAPNIPNGVTNLSYCFSYCTALTTPPTIPSTVTDMDSCFQRCSSLTTAPQIPSGVTKIRNCFSYCTALTTPPTIPSTVTNMGGCFQGCSSLTTAPQIPSGVTKMNGCFKNCSSLTTAPNIPSGVDDMFGCFDGCTSLKTAPVIPSSVTDITAAFFGCSSLDGVITVHGEPTAYTNAFYGTKKPIYIYDDYIGGENFWTNIASTYSNVHYRLKDVPPSNTTITAYRVEHDGDETPYKQGQYVFVCIDTKYSAENTPNDTVITVQTPSLSMDNHDITPTWATTQSEGRSVSKAWVEQDDFLQHTLSASQTIQYSVPNLFSDNSTSPASSVILEKLYALINAFHDEESGTEGIAFGTLSTMPNSLLVAMDAYFMDKNNVMRALFDFVYPIGSYYETSDTSFNPNDTWGGTWVLETEGQVHISAGANYAVSGALTDTTDGGDKDAIIPYHNHSTTITQPTFTIPNHTHKGYYRKDNTTGGKADRIGHSGAYAAADIVTTTSSGGGGACNRTTNVAVTVNYAGTSGNATDANMQPYIIVNRWHRTA